MQGFGGLYLHRLAGGDADADNNHEGNQYEADGGTEQQAVPLQRCAVPPGIQLQVRKIIIDEQCNGGDNCQQ